MYIHHPPGVITITGKYEGTMPALKDGGKHVSDCEWVYDSGKRIQAKYQVEWQLWYQSDSESWFIAYCMNALNFPGVVPDDIPRVEPFDFPVSENEAHHLMSANHILDRGHMIESLMDNHRDQAFLLFKEERMHEPEVPEIKFKREETTK